MNDDKEIIVDAEYFRILEERSIWLGCLEAAGVDNWSGYDEAQELMENEND